MLLSPPRHPLSNHRPLSSHFAAAGQRHIASTAAQQLAALLTPPHTVLYITAGISSFSTGIFERIKNFSIPKSFI
jgi:hypothetical protein